MAFDPTDPAFILGALGLLTGGLSLAYTRRMVAAAHRQADEAEKARRQQVAVDVIRSFETPEFAKMIVYMRQQPIPRIADEAALLPPEAQEMNVLLAQRFENMGIVVAEGIIDIDLVDKCLGSYVTDTWDRRKSAIAGLRSKYRDRLLAEYFEWLAEALRERARQNPRLAAYQRVP
ncbi:MAG: DUF4760 domain-containing protein [Thermoplasmatota archaeon]